MFSKGSVSVVDDTKLFDERALKARVDAQDNIPAIPQGLSHISGYPTLLNNSPTTRLEVQGIVKLQNDNPERRRGLGHSSSSPSLSTQLISRCYFTSHPVDSSS
jgi:hypothetical protein